MSDLIPPTLPEDEDLAVEVEDETDESPDEPSILDGTPPLDIFAPTSFA